MTKCSLGHKGKLGANIKIIIISISMTEAGNDMFYFANTLIVANWNIIDYTVKI